jgi:hypothetical protein
MGAVNLPEFDKLVQGNDYVRPSAPTSDAADYNTNPTTIPNVPQGQPSPLTHMSIASESRLADPLGAFLPTNLHQDNWLDPMKPHVSPEPQSPKV